MRRTALRESRFQECSILSQDSCSRSRSGSTGSRSKKSIVHYVPIESAFEIVCFEIVVLTSSSM